MDAASKTEIEDRIRLYESMSLRELLRRDLKAHEGAGAALTSMGFWAVLLFRVSTALSRHHLDLLARLIQAASSLVLNCDISRRAIIGPGLRVYHPTGIFIGPCCRIGENCQIGPGAFMSSNTNPFEPAGYPTLGDDVTVGPGGVVLGPAVVGDHVRVGPHVVVTGHIPEHSSLLPPPYRVLNRHQWHKRG